MSLWKEMLNISRHYSLLDLLHHTFRSLDGLIMLLSSKNGTSLLLISKWGQLTEYLSPSPRTWTSNCKVFFLRKTWVEWCSMNQLFVLQISNIGSIKSNPMCWKGWNIWSTAIWREGTITTHGTPGERTTSGLSISMTSTRRTWEQWKDYGATTSKLRRPKLIISQMPSKCSHKKSYWTFCQSKSPSVGAWARWQSTMTSKRGRSTKRQAL